MPKKKKLTGPQPKCTDAASRLAHCRWKKDRQKKLDKEVDAREAKAAKAKAAKRKPVNPKPKPNKPKKPKSKPTASAQQTPNGKSDAKRLRDAGRRVPQGKKGAKTDTSLF